MARATYSGIGITDLQGSIGGTTFQHNLSGKIVRRRPRIISKFSTKQVRQQLLLDAACRLWSNLTLIQQSDWNLFAAAHTKDNFYGETKTLTGFNWFVSINSYLYLVGGTLLDTPPAWVPPDAINPYTFYLDGNDIIIDFTASYSQVEQALCIFTTPPVSATSTALRNKFILTDVITTSPLKLINLTAAWQTAHGCNYPIYSEDFHFRIGLLMFNIDTSNGLTSAAALNIDMLSNITDGIGYMIIGNNFEVF